MFPFDHSMLEGSPLHYYSQYKWTSCYVNQFPFFEKFGEVSSNMPFDVNMPASPNSVHSDSDNSSSSVEVSSLFINKKMQTTKSDSKVQCCWKSCGVYFDSLDQLAIHVSKVHSSSGTGGLFYCGWEGCTRNNRGFNARYKMLVHVRTHTNEKPHQCSQCDKSFSRAENLKIHSRSHSGEKPYVCPIPGCNKAYSNSSDRFKHTRTHQVEKPYECKIPGCPKRYTDPSSLRKHVKTYKHFITENRSELEASNTNVTKNGCIENKCNRLYDNKCDKINASSIQNCSCPHNCCNENISKAAELLKLGGFLNFPRVEIKAISWNKMLDPFISESASIFPSHECKTEGMDTDLPLDLSISHKNM